MKDPLEELARIKAQAEVDRTNRDEARGALKLFHARLESEHGCKTVKEAETLLGSLEAKVEALEQKVVRLLEEFQRKWGDRL